MTMSSFLAFPMDNLKPAVFLDRDGTLIEDVGILTHPEQIRLFPDTIDALQALSGNYVLFVVSNQPGISKGLVTSQQVASINFELDDLLRKKNVRIRKWYICPHQRNENCRCIKPNPFFLQEAAYRYGIDLSRSFIIGDHPHDVYTGDTLGVFGLYLLTGHGGRHLPELPADRLVFHSLLEAAHWISKHPQPAQQLDTSVRDASAVIKKGGVVAFPTETVYGLGADVFNTRAVAKIFKSKRRPLYNPLIVHIAEIEQLASLVSDLPDTACSLINCFWPGPLTLIFHKRQTVPDIVTAGLSTVAVRMPAHPLAEKFIRLSETPIAAPSANVFGRTSPTSATHLMDQLQNVCDAVIDGGACRIGLESTVLSLTDAKPRLLRPGAITQNEIEQVIGRLMFSAVPSAKPGPLESPGMLSYHYATKTPLYLVDNLAVFSRRPDVGVLLFTPSELMFEGPVELLSPSGDLIESATNLYAAMQKLDLLGLSAIIAKSLDQTGIGIAINDRLRKASFKTGQPPTEHAKKPTRSPYS